MILTLISQKKICFQKIFNQKALLRGSSNIAREVYIWEYFLEVYRIHIFLYA